MRRHHTGQNSRNLEPKSPVGLCYSLYSCQLWGTPSKVRGILRMGSTSWLTPGWVETHSLTKGSGWAAQVCTGLCGENCLLTEPCRDSHYLGFWIPNMGRAFYSCLCVFVCIGVGGKYTYTYVCSLQKNVHSSVIHRTKNRNHLMSINC